MQFHRTGLDFSVSLDELESCYLNYIPDGDTADHCALHLYLKDGREKPIDVNNVHEGFLLYQRLLNCAPHLLYQFPKKHP